MIKKTIGIFLFISICISSFAEDGYNLWLRYNKISNIVLLNKYKAAIQYPFVVGQSATTAVTQLELGNALSNLFGSNINCNFNSIGNSTLICGTPDQSSDIDNLSQKLELEKAGKEGYVISTQFLSGKKRIIIGANTDIGVLYGVFHLLRLLQTNQSIDNLNIHSAPKLNLRLLNHWDNLNRTVERGYAGFSIWDWHKLPGYIDKRYTDYARANASIGINGTVLTNVNANATVLTESYLKKVAALANVFRPYGIKVYLTARFSSPIEIGGLKTADPLDKSVQDWWKKKADEIYSLIPDFGGFLVKANSEGQPGPQAYGRNHADGANMLADAVAPHGGIVMWRAFVYSNETPEDRHKQAYNEFVPLDGKFRDNVMVQVKNGAIDFMPREPFHPLFGAMPKTPLMMEFQITQEYTGQSTNLVYLAPLYKEVLNSDTYSRGQGSTVANVIDGSLDKHTLNGIAGVSNIGNDINWCGHPFAQANWYALGRLSWNYSLSSDEIADEWLRMTFTNDTSFIVAVKKMMLTSRETMVNYMNPLGLHHLMGTGHHYGPAPWVNDLPRADWNPVYYHKADSIGIGFDRTSSGSNAISQYSAETAKKFANAATCPDEYLLWFHHLAWNFKMKNGRSLWNELCHRYYAGAESVRDMQKTWAALQSKIDSDRYQQVKMLLQIQQEEATWWRNACLLYFQTFSKLPIPPEYEKPNQTLNYYQQLRFPYAPGN